MPTVHRRVCGRGQRGIPQSTDELYLPRNPAREAAAMETTAVTCARVSRLQRKILRIYLKTNKIMMVLLTLTAPHPRLLPLSLSSLPHSSLPFLNPLPNPISPRFLPISTSISLSLLLSRSLSYSLIISVFLCFFISPCVSALHGSISWSLLHNHRWPCPGMGPASWSLVQASPDLSSLP